MITTLLFDIDDTLLDFAACAGASMKQAMADTGLTYEDCMLPVFLEENEKLWKMLERGELKDVDELYAVRWNIIFKVLGIEADGPAFEKLFLKYLELSHEMVDGAEEVLETLKDRGYKIYTISNAPHQQQVIRLEACGLMNYIEGIFTSESIGAVKPSEAFFAKVFAEIGTVGKDEVIVIGDSLTADIAGGVKAGLTTCWFNRKGRTIEHEADFEILKLEDLKELSKGATPCRVY